MPRVSRGTRTNQSHKGRVLPPKYTAGFLTTLDGRTELARGLRERFDSIVADLGGPGELSQIKASLVERFVWLEASLMSIEAAMAETTDPKQYADLVARWTQACNTLLGIGKSLGIDRKLGSAPWLAEAKQT